MNKDFDLEDLLNEVETEDDGDSTPSELNLDVIKSKLPLYSTQKVAEMVVTGRYFGFDKEITVTCMEELAKRREGGDQFPFETFIDNSLKSLPVLNFAMPDLRTMLSQLSKKGAQK
jgi:hypothetical protein